MIVLICLRNTFIEGRVNVLSYKYNITAVQLIRHSPIDFFNEIKVFEFANNEVVSAVIKLELIVQAVIFALDSVAHPFHYI